MKIVSHYFNHLSRSERAKPVTPGFLFLLVITDGIGNSRMVIAAADVNTTSKLPNITLRRKKKWINDYNIWFGDWPFSAIDRTKSIILSSHRPVTTPC